jgi:hypothetical protein
LSRAQADPPNRGVGGFNLIPVAVVRDIQQAIPVSGNFIGMTDFVSRRRLLWIVRNDDYAAVTPSVVELMTAYPYHCRRYAQSEAA